MHVWFVNVRSYLCHHLKVKWSWKWFSIRNAFESALYLPCTQPHTSTQSHKHTYAHKYLYKGAQLYLLPHIPMAIMYVCQKIQIRASIFYVVVVVVAHFYLNLWVGGNFIGKMLPAQMPLHMLLLTLITQLMYDVAYICVCMCACIISTSICMCLCVGILVRAPFGFCSLHQASTYWVLLFVAA